ncbi:MAG TPA: NAD(P)H-hydrate dehydratase [Verrucomicrobiota bacterium]|nr:NAD(P)H-hydrate dehydratase [Verrucomicrobiota bacterium]HNU51328.1 NAD(P)H-hydrate dehydratase [Verrucomicrobiota bacterium]
MPVPVLTTTEMRSWEQATWDLGQSESNVIDRVGACVARQALDCTRPGDRLLFLAGKGHNGDDVRAAAWHCTGRRVTLLAVSDPATARSLLASALEPPPALIVDGLFGIGLNRPLSADWIRLIETVNAAPTPVLAVDVPSGLSADTGQPLGTAVRAAITLTVGAPKRGLLAPAAAPYVGRLEVATKTGLAPCPVTTALSWTLPDDFHEFPPPRPPEAHKGKFGHLGILAGSLGYHGAAVLAARGAQRAQPGLVTLRPSPDVYVPVASQLQSVMVQSCPPESAWPTNLSALLVGPGLAAPSLPSNVASEVRSGWRSAPWPVVADASALDWLPPGPTQTPALRVITPHPGEAARLLESSPASVQSDRCAALRALSARYGNCWVVLKGRHTLVGRNSDAIHVNPSGNPGLAQGGSGDLLAGFLAGLLAQPSLLQDPLQTIRYAVWAHSQAADDLAASRKAWTVEELAQALGSSRPHP